MNSSTFHLKSPGATALFTGCIIAIVLPVIAFLVFVINRSLRVKRLNIIAINICFSVIILYVGFLISLFSSDRDSSFYSDVSPACVTGALFVLFGWFCLHFWILVNWIFLGFTFHQRIYRHISHFFIKSTIPTYGSALLFFVVIAAMGASQKEKYLINSKFCWYDLQYEQGVEWVFFLATTLSVVGIVCLATFCVVTFTCKKNNNSTAARTKKNKLAAIRLAILTLVIFFTSALQLSWWLSFSRNPDLATKSEFKEYSSKINLNDERYEWLKILHGIFIAIEGISVVLYLVLPKDNFHGILTYCTAVVKCQDLNTAQPHNVRSTVRSSKHGDNNNIIDVRASMSSDDRPKYEPREDVAQEEVFVASAEETTPTLTVPPADKRRSRVSATKADRGSPGSPRRPDELGDLPPNSSQPKKKGGIRVSFRKSMKSPVSPAASQPIVDVASSAPSTNHRATPLRSPS